MTSKRVKVIMAGRVQGVFLRASLQETARDLGLTGWARNRPDGRVEAELQGSPEAVDEAVAFCRGGPGHADVSDVVVEPAEPVSEERDFEVR